MEFWLPILFHKKIYLLKLATYAHRKTCLLRAKGVWLWELLTWSNTTSHLENGLIYRGYMFFQGPDLIRLDCMPDHTLIACRCLNLRIPLKVLSLPDITESLNQMTMWAAVECSNSCYGFNHPRSQSAWNVGCTEPPTSDEQVPKVEQVSLKSKYMQ